MYAVYLWFVSAIGGVRVRKRVSSKVNRSLAKINRLIWDLHLDGSLPASSSIQDKRDAAHRLVTRAYASLIIIGREDI